MKRSDVWRPIRGKLEELGRRWFGQGIEIDPLTGEADERALRRICAEATAIMKAEAHALAAGDLVDGWEIRIWNPNEFRKHHSITLVAADAGGVVAYDIDELVAGAYDDEAADGTPMKLVAIELCGISKGAPCLLDKGHDGPCSPGPGRE